MSIQEKEVAYLCTTGEPVFVLHFIPEPGGGVEKVSVRRPWGGTQNGLTHTVETFLVEELESRIDHLKRLSERKREEMELDKALFNSIISPAESDEEETALATSLAN